MYKFFAIFGGTLISVFLCAQSAYAYGVETHAFLMEETILFHNENSGLKISNDYLDIFAKGVRGEDDAPRWMNHFYDPTNNNGLNDGTFFGISSKIWVQDETAQSSWKYKTISLSGDTNFTWQNAIDLYAQGNTEEAFFTLGHVIHLIQDTTVPEHVRNDAHPPFDNGGSPYENWTHRYDMSTPDRKLSDRLSGKKPIILRNLNAQFDAVAEYTNNNFYSRDSIENYNLPKPDYYKDEFGMKKDTEFNDYRLSYLGIFNWTGSGEVVVEDVYVISDYWDRLSVKAVQYGAGTLELFMRKAEAAKTKYENEHARRPYLGLFMSGLSSIFGSRTIDVSTGIDNQKNGVVLGTQRDWPDATNIPIIPTPIIPVPSPTPLVTSMPVQTPSPTPKPAVAGAGTIPKDDVASAQKVSDDTGNEYIFVPYSGGGGTVRREPGPGSTLILVPTPTPTTTPTPSPTPASSCLIKGNISGNGEKIYHIIGCSSYNMTKIDESKGEQWFCSEEEALSSGWRKALTCPELIPSPTPEPVPEEERSAVTSPENFSVVYNEKTLEVNFSWSTVSSHTYILSDTSKSEPVILAETAFGSADMIVRDVGRQYSFSLTAYASGSASDPVSADVFVPGLLESLTFFRDPRTASPAYAVDFRWTNYPISSIALPHFGSRATVSSNWHVIVLSYNAPSTTVEDILWIPYQESSYTNWGLVALNGFSIIYPNCFGGNYKTIGSALIMPASPADCSSISGKHASLGLNAGILDDFGITVQVADDMFSSQSLPGPDDYISVSYYAYQPGFEPNNTGVGFLASDARRFYFFDDTPALSAPVLDGEIQFSLSEGSSMLSASWDEAYDPDTPDSYIFYDVAYASESIQTVERTVTFPVQAGMSYTVTVRALDDFENISEPLSDTFFVPSTPLPYDIESISWFGGSENSNLILRLGEYPFMGEEINGAIMFFLNQRPPEDFKFLDRDYRFATKVGESNRVLEVTYSPCTFGGEWEKTFSSAAIFFNGFVSCDDGYDSSIFASNLLAAPLSSANIELVVDVTGVLENDIFVSHGFGPDDYVSVGFYERQPKNWWQKYWYTNVSNWSGRIYFQPVEAE